MYPYIFLQVTVELYSSQQDYGGLVSMPLSLHFRLVVADVMLYFGVCGARLLGRATKITHWVLYLSLCDNWVGGRLKAEDSWSLCDPPTKQSIKLGCRRPPQCQAVRFLHVILEVISIMLDGEDFFFFTNGTIWYA